MALGWQLRPGTMRAGWEIKARCGVAWGLLPEPAAGILKYTSLRSEAAELTGVVVWFLRGRGGVLRPQPLPLEEQSSLLLTLGWCAPKSHSCNGSR